MTPLTTVSKHALLVGINKYMYPEVPLLRGCVNDVEVMAGVLQTNFGFPTENVMVLRNEEATRVRIIREVNALVARVQMNDIVVVHYSGHGSQMTDREHDEPDGMDETIVPHDSGRRIHPNNDITDDEIHLWLLALTHKTPHVTLIFDCCHSGTISRDVFGDAVRQVEPDLRPIGDLQVSPLPSEPSRGFEYRRGTTAPSGWLPLGQGYVLIAACHDDERAYEHQVSGISYGTLTYFLSQELLSIRPGSTYGDVFERASAQVTAAKRWQHPQMEGMWDREVFGVRHLEPMRFLAVQQRTSNSVILAGGLVHGLTVGSLWGIYPQGTTRITEATTKLGQVEISRVYASTAEARIVEETHADAIQPSARAMEEAHAQGEIQLDIEVAPAAGYENEIEAMASAIKASPLLRPAQSTETADIRVYVVPPREHVNDRSPLPQLGAISQPTWGVVGRDGQLVMPLHVIAELGARDAICDNLNTIAHYRFALNLRNADTMSLLRDNVEFALLRFVGGTWTEAKPQQEGGHVVYQNGDLIAFRVANHASHPVHVAVLDFGLTGKITLLYPVRGASEVLAPGCEFQVGTRSGDEIELYMPGEFPFVSSAKNQRAAEGMEVFKLFVTTEEVDFSFLAQDTLRGRADHRHIEASSSPLTQLLQRCSSGAGTRDVRSGPSVVSSDWATIERPFVLRRDITGRDIRPCSRLP